MLSSLRVQKKQQKHDAALHKKFNPEEDLPWSDEESDWIPNVVQSVKQYVRKKDPLDSGDNTSRPNTSRPSTPGGKAHHLEQSTIIEPGKFKDHKRSFFSGDAKTQTEEERDKLKILLQSQYNCRIPLPYVPSYVLESIGLNGLFFLWDQFLAIEEVDESELIRSKYIETIIQNFAAHVGVSYHQLYCIFDAVDDDDFVEFTEVAKKLAANLCAIPPNFPPPTINLAVCCCASSACRIHATSSSSMNASSTHRKLLTTSHNEAIRTDPTQEDALRNFPLFVVYQRYKQKYNGLVRVKHLKAIMDESFLKYDPDALPTYYLSLYREFIIKSFHELTWIICRVCCILLTSPDMYRIPEWLTTVYKLPFLRYFQMKFMESDSEGYGCLTDAELLNVFRELGCAVTLLQVVPHCVP
jgi:hypothetical protein